MNKKQLEILTRDSKIKVDDLENKSDKTLLFGKTSLILVDKIDKILYYHLYLKDEMFYFTIYTNPKNEFIGITYLKSFKYREEIEIGNILDLRGLMFYPECCDFEFCNLLKSKGIKLNFLKLDNDRPTKTYYGILYDELTKVKKISKVL